jgi:hypothetical protein
MSFVFLSIEGYPKHKRVRHAVYLSATATPIFRNRNAVASRSPGLPSAATLGNATPIFGNRNAVASR